MQLFGVQIVLLVSVTSWLYYLVSYHTVLSLVVMPMWPWPAAEMRSRFTINPVLTEASFVCDNLGMHLMLTFPINGRDLAEHLQIRYKVEHNVLAHLCCCQDGGGQDIRPKPILEATVEDGLFIMVKLHMIWITCRPTIGMGLTPASWEDGESVSDGI